MAKGKKTEPRTDNKPANSKPVTSKENKPTTNADCAHKSQSVLQGLRSPSKARSPLCDSSSMLLQEGNEHDGTNGDTPKLRKDTPNEISPEICEPKEQKASPGLGISGRVTDQAEPTAHTNGGSRTPKTPKPQSRSGRKPRAKKTEKKASDNRKVTDYFPIRRSNRKTKGELKSEEHKHLDDLIKSGTEEGMQVRHIEGKGRGVFAVNGFKKGEFVVEYHGDLLELTEAKEREARYAQDPQTGCYMYYFQYQSKTYCVDATKETSRLGRLVNHSKAGNCQTKLHAIDGTPHLILVASKDIEVDEELLYDYGDRSKASILAHPWLKH